MQITYSDGINTVTMPVTRPYTIGGVPEGREITLAGGKKRMNMRGFRIVFDTSWDWVPREDIVKLANMVRYNKYLMVSYYDPVGGPSRRRFSVSSPTLSTKWWENGAPRFHNITVHHESQELIKHG